MPIKSVSPISVNWDFLNGEKVALVLTGGGAKGRFQAGALKWIDEIGLLQHVELIVGTSAGGLNTLATAKYIKDYNKVIEMWDGIKKNTDIYDGKMDFWGVAKVLFFKFKSILNPQGLYKVLNKHFAGMNLSDFPVEVAVSSTNLNKVAREVFYPEQTKGFDAVLLGKMTSAIPAVFQAQEINGQVYVDGGVGNNTPVETAIELGATKIIMIGCMPKTPLETPIKNNAMNVLFSTVNALLAIPEQDMWEDIKEKYPNVEILKLYAEQDTGDALNFANPELMQIGYDTAVKYITPEKIEEWKNK
jgi:NTE family protein